MVIERLQTIISYFGLTPSSLADSIGVPRSSISHLLSGRNKPSLDFVLKLVKKYPEVNLYWLLNGKGEFPSTKSIPQKTSVLNLATDNTKKERSVLKFPKQDKTIRRIVVLYEDGTFDTYQPDK